MCAVLTHPLDVWLPGAMQSASWLAGSFSLWLPMTLCPAVSGVGPCHFQNFLFFFPGGKETDVRIWEGMGWLEGPVWNSLILGEKETVCRVPWVPHEPSSSSFMGFVGHDTFTPITSWSLLS